MNNSFVKYEWKCNACGARFDEPENCKTCGTSHCPNCKIANSLMNTRVWDEIVSHNKPLPYSQFKHKKKKQTKAKGPRKPGKKNVARLLEELDVN